MSAFTELLDYLEPDEQVIGIVFAHWDNVTVGKLLTLKEAKPMMQSWAFFGGYGNSECPATYIWTDTRVIWITVYDGSTVLDSAPRNPIDIIPDMPGGQ